MTRGGSAPRFDPEPWIESLGDGSLLSVSGRAWFYDQARQAYHCTSVLHEQKFYLQGIQLQGERFTLINACKGSQLGMTFLDASQASVQIHQMLHSEDVNDIIDVCSGYAVMTAGYHLLHCKVRCHVEINPRYAAWLRTRKTPVIEGDIDSTDVQVKLIPYTERPCILTGGFACQPFSQLGDQRQQLDPRARSFEGMVMACYLFQPAAMILECTKEAMTSTWVQSTLQHFCKLTGYSFQQQVCHLQDFWPAKRTRWWAIIVHPYVNMPPLRSFPSLAFKPSFRHLLLKIATWPDEQVNELQLTALELEVFAEQPGGLGCNAVNPTKPLQTALHAWGSQLTACACGCRAGGFTPKRLEEKGLYGALVPITGSTIVRGQEIANMRHIHPDEVAVLHMVPTKRIQQEKGRNLRLDLTALGQMASPAQALWRVAQVMQAFGNAFGAPTHHALAEQGLLRLAVETFAARDEMLHPFAHTKESALFQAAIHAKFGVEYEFTAHPVDAAEGSGNHAQLSHTRGHLKRKMGDSEEGSLMHQAISPTGGIELFANRSAAKPSQLNTCWPTQVRAPDYVEAHVDRNTLTVRTMTTGGNAQDLVSRATPPIPSSGTTHIQPGSQTGATSPEVGGALPTTEAKPTDPCALEAGFAASHAIDTVLGRSLPDDQGVANRGKGKGGPGVQRADRGRSAVVCGPPTTREEAGRSTPPQAVC